MTGEAYGSHTVGFNQTPATDNGGDFSDVDSEVQNLISHGYDGITETSEILPPVETDNVTCPYINPGQNLNFFCYDQDNLSRKFKRFNFDKYKYTLVVDAFWFYCQCLISLMVSLKMRQQHSLK